MNEQFRNNKRNSKKNENSPKIITTEVPAPPVRNEIPMYNSQTGEPNPHYEELTGKQNPLLEMRKSNIHSKMPLPYEPKKKNRWIVTFPESMGINSWAVYKTKRPTYRVIEKKIFGVLLYKKIVWDEIKIEFHDPIGPSTSQLLMCDFKPKEKFDYKLELLDPTGVVIEQWEINSCDVKSVDFC